MNPTKDELASRGFLSREVDTFRDQIRERFSKEFAACERVSDIVSEVIAAVELDHLDHPHRLHELAAVAFWLRSVSACQGAIILLERGLAAEAGALIRTAFEHVVYASAMVTDESVFNELKVADEVSRLKRADHMKKAGAESKALADEQQSALQTLIEGIGEPTGTRRNTEQLAKSIGLEYEYATIFRTLSATSAHPTLSGLNAVSAIDEEGTLSLRFGPSADNVRFHLGLVELCLKQGYQRIKQVF